MPFDTHPAQAHVIDRHRAQPLLEVLRCTLVDVVPCIADEERFKP
jgi:hypothetical protein